MKSFFKLIALCLFLTNCTKETLSEPSNGKIGVSINFLNHTGHNAQCDVGETLSMNLSTAKDDQEITVGADSGGHIIIDIKEGENLKIVLKLANGDVFFRQTKTFNTESPEVTLMGGFPTIEVCRKSNVRIYNF